MTTAFYCPGKKGDALLQAPIAYWWARENGQPVEMWLDEGTCAPLIPLFAAQMWVSHAKLVEASKGYQCGGQPWTGNFSTEDHTQHQIISLGFRQFPERQITLEVLTHMPFKLDVEPAALAETPCFEVGAKEKVSRVVLHGTGICAHNNQTPSFWRFLAGIRHDLAEHFDQIVFVGTERERRMALDLYGHLPKVSAFNDDGDFLKLGNFIGESELVVACGSSVAALAGALKIPCLRVHDPIGEAPRTIWDNLGANQLNRTEKELRRLWPEWRDTWVRGKVPA